MEFFNKKNNLLKLNKKSGTVVPLHYYSAASVIFGRVAKPGAAVHINRYTFQCLMVMISARPGYVVLWCNRLSLDMGK